MDESREFYVNELLRVTGMQEDHLRKLHIKELFDLYVSRVLEGGGMI